MTNNIAAAQAESLIRIIDDDEGIRDSLALLLERNGWQVHSYASAKEFLAAPDIRTPGCIVLDVMMPEIDGLELQQQLRTLGSNLPVVFLTGHGNVHIAVQAMRSGASHFLQKEDDPTIILEAIETFAGESWEEKNRAEDNQHTSILSRFSRLTTREQQIVQMTRTLTSRDIAEQLGISERTVENHRISACKKFPAQNTLEILKSLDSLN